MIWHWYLYDYMIIKDFRYEKKVIEFMLSLNVFETTKVFI